MSTAELFERFARVVSPVLDGEDVEVVFPGNRNKRWPAGLVCTPRA